MIAGTQLQTPYAPIVPYLEKKVKQKTRISLFLGVVAILLPWRENSNAEQTGPYRKMRIRFTEVSPPGSVNFYPPELL